MAGSLLANTHFCFSAITYFTKLVHTSALLWYAVCALSLQHSLLHYVIANDLWALGYSIHLPPQIGTQPLVQHTYIMKTSRKDIMSKK